MPKRSPLVIASRKQPRQDRSSKLVDAILEAAIRVLKREGARRFTTVRVAEEAGVSVGSLYQYFPNKGALLFRLQSDEWKDTGDILHELLSDARFEPLERLRRAVRMFFRSEREEAELRVALDDAGALFRDAPEARAHVAIAMRGVLAFMNEALPNASQKERVFAADFVGTSMSAVAERITQEGRARADVDAWAEASAEMYCAFLGTLDARAKSAKGKNDVTAKPRRRRGAA